MNNQMPMAVWRAGMDKIEAATRPVGMPLRLDNANAFPHTHSRAETTKESGLKAFRRGRKRKEQAILHLNSNGPWSHEWGPLQSKPITFRYETESHFRNPPMA